MAISIKPKRSSFSSKIATFKERRKISVKTNYGLTQLAVLRVSTQVESKSPLRAILPQDRSPLPEISRKASIKLSLSQR